MGLFLTTTGTLSPVVIDDLDGRAFIHPTISYNLLTEYTEDEIQSSDDLQSLVTAGHIEIRDDYSNLITTVQLAGPHDHVADQISDLSTAIGSQPDVTANTAARHTHSNKSELDLVTDGDHDIRTDDPHNVTSTQVGLGNVTNDAQLKRSAGDFSTFLNKTIPLVNDVVLIEDSADSNNKKYVTLSSLPSAAPLSKLFQANDGTGGMAITTSVQPIDLDVEYFKDDYYSHSTTINPSEIEILQTGLYELSARSTVETTSNTAGIRGNPVLQIQVDSGGGWIAIPHYTGEYIREDNINSLSASMSSGPIPYSFTAGDKIRLVIYDTVGTPPTEQTVGNGSALFIKYIDRTGSLSGTVDNLKDIGDVNAPAPNNRDIIRFNNVTSEWDSYQDTMPELVPVQVSSNYSPTFAQLQNAPVIIVDTTIGNVDVVLPAADTISGDGLIHRVWVHHINGTNVCSVSCDGENFYDGLINSNIKLHETVQLGGMNMGVGNPGWLRIGNTKVVLQARRAATWAAVNFTTPTAIPWDTLIKEDNNNVLNWDIGTPTRLTAKYGGNYNVNFVFNIDSVGGATWVIQAQLRINGTIYVPGTYLRTGNYGGEDQCMALPNSGDIYLNANDYIEVVIIQNLLTGNLNSAAVCIETKV